MGRNTSYYNYSKGVTSTFTVIANNIDEQYYIQIIPYLRREPDRSEYLDNIRRAMFYHSN